MFQTILLLTTLIAILLLLYIKSKVQIKVLKKYSSPLSGDIIIRQYPGNEISLDFNTYAQGLDPTNPRISSTYWYYMAQKALENITKKENAEVLHFGLGSATTPRIIANALPTTKQTIIEIDPIVITANKEYFHLNEIPNTTVIQADAFTIVNEEKTFTEKFDAIIIDICTGQPPYISYEASEPAFIQKIKEWTKPGGVLVFNRWIDTEENREDAKKTSGLLNKNIQKCYFKRHNRLPQL